MFSDLLSAFSRHFSSLGPRAAGAYNFLFENRDSPGVAVLPTMARFPTLLPWRHQDVVVGIAGRVPHPPKGIMDTTTPTLVPFEEYLRRVEAGTMLPPVRPPEACERRFRTADGSCNNLTHTFMGQGGRGYSMETQRTAPAGLPTPEALWTELLKRPTSSGDSSLSPSAPPHDPTLNNSIFVWWAMVVVHDFFRSDTGRGLVPGETADRPWVNLHSSFLDLQPLYGFTKERQDSIRTMTGGKLKEDVFEDDRFQDPRLKSSLSSAFLVLLNREHNAIADELARLYPDQFPTDELLYQQARLITIGVYVNCTLRLYTETLLGNAPASGDSYDIRHVPRKFSRVGNHVPYEFNLMYRFHAMLPDEALAPPPQDFDQQDAADRNARILAQVTQARRLPLLRALPRSVPDALRDAEIKAIVSAREMGVGTYNSFRQMLNLPAYADDDWSWCQDDLVDTVKKLYKTVGQVELYPALYLEKRGRDILGPTAAFAILADAFSAILQDRFFTEDFTPEVYTAFGLARARSTTLVDLLNRHCNAGLARTEFITKLPGATHRPGFLFPFSKPVPYGVPGKTPGAGAPEPPVAGAGTGAGAGKFGRARL